ncbi:MAG: hypothetical protein HXS46_04565 [Theionarchaea archaeon]|nr:MAG: hypothetical protein AYK18_15735 [Theionarchaea archaeon DG-70]MBU7009938.1 hypothetical protein [Theionarchaea archaeon]
MKIISNRFSLILYCAIFNLLFEYSARGLPQFISRPLFMFALFGIYFTYFSMLEDLIVRFRLKNYQIFLCAFLYGLFPIAFLTGNLFNTNVYSGIMLAGVNMGTLIIIGILAWGVVQGIITLYFANRLQTRDWNHPRMGKVGWTSAVLYQLLVMIYAHRNPVTPRGTPLGYLVFGLLVIVAVTLFIRSLKIPKPSIQPFQPSKFMDFLAFGSVAIFFILGTFFISGAQIVTSQPLNLLAVTLENIWVIFCGLTFFIYRLQKKSDVVV